MSHFRQCHVFNATLMYAVQDLICLIERYLEPLKEETFLTSDDIDQLFGNIQEIVQFQKLFLHSLEDAIESDSVHNAAALNEPRLLKVCYVRLTQIDCTTLKP